MTDHVEEQEMEAEALSAIFDSSFKILNPTQPFVWSVRLVPVDCGDDEEEDERVNHVAVRVVATIPVDYPEGSGPELDVEIEKGLAEPQRREILSVAQSEAEANDGMPAVFAICEAVRAWLGDNNEKGLDDGSMHAQMMRKRKEEERSKAKQTQKFESQKKVEEMTEAELEELAVRKRRSEGTPCTRENFDAWKAKFDAEMEELAAREEEEEDKDGGGGGKKKGGGVKKDEQADRMTGYEIFSGRAGVANLEALEAAAEEVVENGEDEDEDEDEADGVEVDGLDVDEGLFDDDDDLDDLDFDDSDDDDDDDEPDI